MSDKDEALEKKLYGEGIFGDSLKPDFGGVLKNEFYYTPFTVFDSLSGQWQSRKRAWIKLGIKSEVGRKDIGDGCFGKTEDSNNFIYKRIAGIGVVSVFDPFLCELMYRWFCPDGGQVVDPFAGGSVRGIVAAVLGRRYWGCDLSSEQIDSNYEQALKVCPEHIDGKYDPVDTIDDIVNVTISEKSARLKFHGLY